MGHPKHSESCLLKLMKSGRSCFTGLKDVALLLGFLSSWYWLILQWLTHETEVYPNPDHEEFLVLQAGVTTGFHRVDVFWKTSPQDGNISLVVDLCSVSCQQLATGLLAALGKK